MTISTIMELEKATGVKVVTKDDGQVNAVLPVGSVYKAKPNGMKYERWFHTGSAKEQQMKGLGWMKKIEAVKALVVTRRVSDWPNAENDRD